MNGCSKDIIVNKYIKQIATEDFLKDLCSLTYA